MSKISLLLPLAAAIAIAAPVCAQMEPEVEAAMVAGTVGEQADGYLGFAREPASGLRAKVDAINIRRREGYTQVAQARNVPIEAFAASIGCKQLGSLPEGRAYSIGRGSWATKSGPVALPPQCG